MIVSPAAFVMVKSLLLSTEIRVYPLRVLISSLDVDVVSESVETLAERDEAVR